MEQGKRMKFRNFGVMIILSFTSLLAWSGNGVGNGGDAVVCYTSPSRNVISSIEMFDYWEMNKILPQAGGLNLGGSKLSVRQKIELAISRLRNFDPELADGVQKYALPMETHIASYLVTAYQLPEIDDVNPRALPTGNCFIEQYAIQWREPVSGQRRFAIAAKFYNVANNDAKAGIILHEAIYKWAIQNGHNDSDGTRYINFVISSTLLDASTTYETYARYLGNANFVDTKCQMVDIPSIGSILAYKDKNQYVLCASKKLSFPKMKITPFRNSIVGYISSEKEWVLAITFNTILSRPDRTNTWLETRLWGKKADDTRSDYGKFRFAKEGYVKKSSSVALAEGAPELDLYIEYMGQKIPTQLWDSEFDSNGDFFKTTLYKDPSVPVYFGTQLLDLSEGPFELDKNGNLLRFTLNSPADFKVPGLNRTVSALGMIQLNTQGEIYWGDLETPIYKTIHGKTIELRDARFNEIGQIDAGGFMFEFTTFDYLGKRLVGDITIRDGLGIKKVCSQIDPNLERVYGYVLSSVVEFIAAPEEFLDAKTGALVFKTDEEVRVVTKISCGGSFYVDL